MLSTHFREERNPRFWRSKTIEMFTVIKPILLANKGNISDGMSGIERVSRPLVSNPEHIWPYDQLLRYSTES